MDDWIETPRSSHVAAMAFETDGVLKLKDGREKAYGTLHVAFKSGFMYSYDGVSLNDFDLICNAQSVGGALHRLGITNPRGRRANKLGTWKEPYKPIPEEGD